MKKPAITFILTLILILSILTAAPALAMENFNGPEAGQFGKSTSVDEIAIIGGYQTEADNINRSKDSALIPPPFGSPSSNTLNAGQLLTPDISGVIPNTGGYGVSGGSTYLPADTGGTLLPPPAAESSTSYESSPKFTLPDGLHYSDTSIGTLSIPKLGVSAKVYEDESLETLAKGIGHFKFTSCWDGNVGFAAHNRGRADYFGQIHTLRSGDRIIYTTKLGTRTYEVYFTGTISETDFSRLGRTSENIVTLITCVRDIPELRWCVQAREIA